MKKELFIVVSLIIFIIISHIYTQNYTRSFFDYILNELDNIQYKIINEEYENEILENEISNVIEKWDSKYDNFAYYIEHEELEKIEIELVSIQSNIKFQNYGKTVESINRCKSILENVEEKDSFKLVNIF